MKSEVDEWGRLIIEFKNVKYQLEFNQYIKWEKYNPNPIIFIRNYDEQFNLTQTIKNEPENSLTQSKIDFLDKKPTQASYKNGQNGQNEQKKFQISTIKQNRPQSCEPVIDSWFIYNQNISRQDLEILYDNRRWLKSNIIDAMANKLNYEIYKKFFNDAREFQCINKLSHVFPTTIFEEMERQFEVQYKGLQVVDCFLYQEELNFVKPIIQELYQRFYFLINQGHHFFLVELDLKSQILYLYDPLYQRTPYSVQKIKQIIQNILCKYEVQIDLKIQQLIPYPRQQDGVNCGIYTLYYLSQLIQDECLTNPSLQQIDPLCERQKLKQMLIKPNPKIRFQKTNYFVSSQKKY